MRKLLIGTLVLVFCASASLADSLDSGTSAAVASAFNPTGSFWNNTSADTVNGSNAANVGNFLSATGAFASPVLGCTTCGVDYMANGGQMYVNIANTPDFVDSLNFVTQPGQLQINLLYANGPQSTLTSFGIYDASNLSNRTSLQAAGTNLNTDIGASYTLAGGSPYSDWGLYVTTCTENASSISQCASDGDLVTYFMGAASEGTTSQDAQHEHFALFQSGTNFDQYYAGVEETAFNANDPNAASNGVEGYGDFNDLIFGITTSVPGGNGGGNGSTSMPEPSSLLLLTFGLVGLGILVYPRRHLGSTSN